MAEPGDIPVNTCWIIVVTSIRGPNPKSLSRLQLRKREQFIASTLLQFHVGYFCVLKKKVDTRLSA